MAEILRVVTEWRGFSGAPGFTNFFFARDGGTGTYTATDATAAVARTRSFWTTVNTRLPAGVTVTVSPTVDVLFDSNGQLQDSLTDPTITQPVQGTAAGAVAGPAGAVVTWKTATIRNGRRIRGRTFLVPLATSSYEVDGTLIAAAVSDFQTAATNLMASNTGPQLLIWGRPTKLLPDSGVSGRVTGFSVPDKVAVLTSRRD